MFGLKQVRNASLIHSRMLVKAPQCLLQCMCACGTVQAQAADLTKRLTAAHESLAQHQLDLWEAQGHLQHTRNKAAALEGRWIGLIMIFASTPFQEALPPLRSQKTMLAQGMCMAENQWLVGRTL